MNINVFGMKFDLTRVLIVVVATLLVCHLIGGCCNFREGMEMMGADVGYKMGEGVHGSWENKTQEAGSSLAHRQQDHDSYGSKFVGPDKALNFFADTDFAPECCGSNYSANGGLTDQGATAGGCACMNKEQINYINARGGNRSMGGSF